MAAADMPAAPWRRATRATSPAATRANPGSIGLSMMTQETPAAASSQGHDQVRAARHAAGCHAAINHPATRAATSTAVAALASAKKSSKP